MTGVERQPFDDTEAQVARLSREVDELRAAALSRVQSKLDKSGGTIAGDVDILGLLRFGSTVRQMLNLYSDTYGIGVQSNTLYMRTNNYFAWYRRGEHDDAERQSGTGGGTLMDLDTNRLHLPGRGVDPWLGTNTFTPADPQSSYPPGLSIMGVSNDSAWPDHYGMLMSMREMGLDVTQQWYHSGSIGDASTPGAVWYRRWKATQSAWTPWTPLTAEPWQTPSFKNGWSQYSSSYPVRYRKEPGGTIRFTGLLKCSDTAQLGQVAFTLPAEYTPTYMVHQPGVHGPGGADDTYTVRVTSAGDMKPSDGGGTTWYSLDGITFPLN